MLHCEVTLVEVRLEKGGTGGCMECPPGLRPAPGQYLLAHAVGHDEALPGGPSAARTASLSLSGMWQPGRWNWPPRSRQDGPPVPACPCAARSGAVFACRFRPARWPWSAWMYRLTACCPWPTWPWSGGSRGAVYAKRAQCAGWAAA